MIDRDKVIQKIMQQTAPGTALRLGIDNVLKANTGGLIVIGDEEEVRKISQGGFNIDAPYTSAHLYELAKMDGAILLQPESYRILKANVHLTPNPETPSKETGIRHRSAEQTARETGALVISISQRRNVISLYKGDLKVVLREPSQLLTLANQALQTLDKYTASFRDALNRLSLEEFDGVVLLTDVLQVIERAELIARIEQELKRYVLELGIEGRLIKMQLEELTHSVEEAERLTILDYMKELPENNFEENIDEIILKLRRLTPDELFNRIQVAKILGQDEIPDASKLEYLETRGYRLLNQIPRLPSNIIENVINHFGDFSILLRATTDDLDEVEGVGKKRSQQIYSGLRRLRSQTIENVT